MSVYHVMTFLGHVTDPYKGLGERWRCPVCNFAVIKWLDHDDFLIENDPPSDPEIVHVAEPIKSGEETNMKQHIMDLITHRPDGSSEWLCPICGRRLAFTRSGSCTILKPGNDGVDHVGEAHGLKLTSPALTSRKNEPVELPEVFKRWAAEHGVE